MLITLKESKALEKFGPKVWSELAGINKSVVKNAFVYLHEDELIIDTKMPKEDPKVLYKIKLDKKINNEVYKKLADKQIEKFEKKLKNPDNDYDINTRIEFQISYFQEFKKSLDNEKVLQK